MGSPEPRSHKTAIQRNQLIKRKVDCSYGLDYGHVTTMSGALRRQARGAKARLGVGLASGLELAGATSEQREIDEMTDRVRTRREMLAGVAVGSGAIAAAFAPTAASDAHDDLGSTHNDPSHVRRRWLERRRRRLDDRDPKSRDGLQRLLDAFRDEDAALTNGDHRLVTGLIDQLFASDDRNTFGDAYESVYSDFVNGATATGRRIVEFVKDNIDAVAEGTDWATVRSQAVNALGVMMSAVGIATTIGTGTAVALTAISFAVIYWPAGE